MPSFWTKGIKMLPVEADMVSLAVIKVTDDAILKLTATEMALGDGVSGP